MVRDESKDRKVKLNWLTWFGFVKKFAAFSNWEHDEHFPKSHFGPPETWHKWYIHADIIVLDGKVFALDPVSWIAFKVWEFRNKA